MQSEKLENCPFCGGGAEQRMTGFHGGNSFVPVCTQCGAMASSHVWWNRRATTRPADTGDMREGFEAWMRSIEPSIELDRDGGTYHDWDATQYWRAWQAAYSARPSVITDETLRIRAEELKAEYGHYYYDQMIDELLAALPHAVDDSAIREQVRRETVAECAKVCDSEVEYYAKPHGNLIAARPEAAEACRQLAIAFRALATAKEG